MADILQRPETPTNALPQQFETTVTPNSPDQDSELVIQRPKRIKLSEEEVLKRMEEFDLRKDKFVATVRAG